MGPMKVLGYKYEIVENNPRAVYKYAIRVWDPDGRLLNRWGSLGLYRTNTEEADTLYGAKYVVRRTVRRAEKLRLPKLRRPRIHIKGTL